MNALDIVLIVMLAAFIVYGAVKGIVRLALGSVALALGVFLGCWFNRPVAERLSGFIENEAVRRLASFGLVFLATLGGFAILVWFITRTLEAAKLRWVDRLSGAALGLAVAALLAGALLVPLTAFLSAESGLVAGSALSPYVMRISAFVKSIVPADLKDRYEAARKRMADSGRGILPGGKDMPLPPSLPEVVSGIEKLAGSAVKGSAGQAPGSKAPTGPTGSQAPAGATGPGKR